MEHVRCGACHITQRRYEISYTIEDLDLEPADQRSSSSSWIWHSKTIEPSSSGDETGPTTSSARPDLRKGRSTDGRWTNSSFLSPDDALWDLKRHTDAHTEFRWELHSSKTDVDLARRAKCGCHTPLTPEEKRHPERGDLRKHHSAEGDKWSLHPDAAGHELRKHLSDNSRIAGEPIATLQVPEVLRNPKPKCTCPKSRVMVSSDTSEGEDQAKSDAEDRRPERSPVSSEGSRRVTLVTEPQVIPSKPPEPQKPAAAKVTSPEEGKKTLRSRWAMKSHFSMPQVERRDSTWAKAKEHPKSRSLKDRHKYSVRRSISPEPDPRQMMRLDNRVVRRLISPGVSLENAKWAPYEGYSPLPNVGIRKREPKKISEIRWEPYEGSPERAPNVVEPQEEEEPKDSATVTPTRHPPPESAPGVTEEEDERWRFLNMISPFPLYQGAWKDESPPKTPPPAEQGTPVWLTTQDLPPEVPRISEPSPSPPKKRSGKSKRKALRTRSEFSKTMDEGLAPPRALSRASSEETRGRPRPQLMRSKALLEVPTTDAMKRSLSEEVPRFRGSQRPARGLLTHRAKSEETQRYDPWLEHELDSPEVLEYVTTV